MKKLFLLATFAFFAVSGHAQQYPEMIEVKGGSFEMGDELGIGEAREQPIHTVTLKTFSIAKTETTVLQWKTYCNATGRKMPETPSWGWIDNHPLENVSWDDAVAYCDWMSDKTGNIYRLPTEAEWEYAARGGKQSKGFKYSGGQSIDGTGWYKENSGTGTKEVAQKKANELGLYDMSGNVWEWCLDWYGDYVAGAQTNPRGAKSGSSRVLRGGSWDGTAARCRVARRDFNGRGDRNNNCGFRVVVPQ
ncbi:MAG: formylglycine-generating enzyme family protein [Ferruginibacter sp.]|nr:formylglycine-generating enzyme family protein [Ferruginibacter sp.]